MFPRIQAGLAAMRSAPADSGGIDWHGSVISGFLLLCATIVTLPTLGNARQVGAPHNGPISGKFTKAQNNLTNNSRKQTKGAWRSRRASRSWRETSGPVSSRCACFVHLPRNSFPNPWNSPRTPPANSRKPSELALRPRETLRASLLDHQLVSSSCDTGPVLEAPTSQNHAGCGHKPRGRAS